MSDRTINLEEIQEKLYEKLKPSGWANVMKTFLLSAEMATILSRLHEQSMDGSKFTPKLKQLFRFLEECPYDKLKTVILLQD